MSIGEILSVAGKALKSRYKDTIKLLLAFMLISFLISFFESILVAIIAFIPNIGKLFSVIMRILVSFVMVPISFGFIKQSILLYNGEENISAFDFLKFAKESWKSVWKLTLNLFVKYIGAVIIFMLSMSCSIMVSTGFYDTKGIFPILSLVGFIISFIWIIVLSLNYAFVNHELAYGENGRISKEIICDSAKYMQGNKGKFILLEIIMLVLSFILTLLISIPVINILAIIGMLILFVPYMQYVFVAFYQSVRNEKISDGNINIEKMDDNLSNTNDDPIQNS